MGVIGWRIVDMRKGFIGSDRSFYAMMSYYKSGDHLLTFHSALGTLHNGASNEIKEIEV